MNNAFKILLIVTFTWNFGLGMFSPIYAVFAQRVGASIFMLGWIYSVYWIVSGVLNLLLARIFDSKIGKEDLLAIGLLITSAECIYLIFVTDPVGLLFAEIFAGIGTACAAPSWDALFAEFVSSKHSVAESGVYEGGTRLVLAGSSFIAGLIVSTINFAMLFIVMAIMESIAASIIIATKPLGMKYFNW